MFGFVFASPAEGGLDEVEESGESEIAYPPCRELTRLGTTSGEGVGFSVRVEGVWMGAEAGGGGGGGGLAVLGPVGGKLALEWSPPWFILVEIGSNERDA